MFTAFVRRPSSPSPDSKPLKCTCKHIPCCLVHHCPPPNSNNHHFNCICPSCIQLRAYYTYYGRSGFPPHHHYQCTCQTCYYMRAHFSQTHLQSPPPATTGHPVNLQYGIGGNIAYPTSTHYHSTPAAHYHSTPAAHYPVVKIPPTINSPPAGAPVASYCYYHGTGCTKPIQHYHVKRSHGCPIHPCYHPKCVEKRKKGKEKHNEEGHDDEKLCDCPNCTICQRQKKAKEQGRTEKKLDKDKWWSMAVPGKEGAVVGVACTIM